MRLADGLARLRLRYLRPLPTLPDLLLIDVPPTFAAPTLPLGRYYPVIIETDAEWHEWEKFLAGERERPVAPDLLDRRPSGLISTDITFAHYDPPAPGWPWILLCRWPPHHVALVADAASHFARSAYTIEVLGDADTRVASQKTLLDTLAVAGPVHVVTVPPSTLAGTA